MAGITEQARKEANLRLLQRSCLREINDIVLTATHVVLYEFICDEWKKCNVEGSMFLTQTPAHYYLIILNRHSTENLQMEVTATMQLQVQDPYLIFRERVGDATRIRGVWFHSPDERVAMTAALQSSIDRLQQGNLPRPPPAMTPAPAPRPPPSSSTTTPRVPQSLSSPNPSHLSGVAALEPLLASVAISAAEATASASAATAGMATPPSARGTAAQSSPSSSSSPSAGLTGGGAGVALDKKSLQLALLSLIQDDRFLDLLHSQYLRVVHARVKKQRHQHDNNNNNNNGTNG